LSSAISETPPANDVELPFLLNPVSLLIEINENQPCYNLLPNRLHKSLLFLSLCFNSLPLISFHFENLFKEGIPLHSIALAFLDSLCNLLKNAGMGHLKVITL